MSGTLTIPHADQDPFTVDGSAEWYSHFERQFQLLMNLNILLPYDLAAILLGIHSKDLKTYVHTKTCTQMFIAAKTWKQPRCPSVGEWINKVWSIQTMEYDSAVKRNELSSLEKT